MAGHSKWANIRIRKGAQDAKRGKAFTKAAKEIMLAAKRGGGDPANNPRLRTALVAARAVNLPKDKIDTAIKKGTGELQAEIMEEITYECYGPGGVAVMIEVVTDNKNRAVAEMRHILSRNGGTLGESGSVGWMFDKRGVLAVAKEKAAEDQVMEAALEAGADDVADEGEYWEVLTSPDAFPLVQQAFDDAGLVYESAEVTMIPKTYAELDLDTARKVLRLTELLDDNDDVQNVYSNADYPDELLKEVGG